MGTKAGGCGLGLPGSVTRSPQGPALGMQGGVMSRDPRELGLCLCLLALTDSRVGLGRQGLPFGRAAGSGACGVQPGKHSCHICYTYLICASDSAPAHGAPRNAHRSAEDVPSSDICRVGAKVIQQSATGRTARSNGRGENGIG